MLDILYEDNHLLAINKPSGMPSQGDQTGDSNAFDLGKAYLKEKYQKPGKVYLGLLHRIDRPTAGVLLFARTSKAAERLSRQFQQRKILKTYWAITTKRPPRSSDELVHYLKKLPDRNIVRAYRTPKEGSQEAKLSYELLEVAKGRYLIEVAPMTGRRHQIRVQLSQIGCPIAGDVKYGAKDFLPGKRAIALLARELEFTHPTTKETVILRAPVPHASIWNMFNS
ncbi:MAG: RluA family pseudouridine synthase [Bacteroidota bacterium]